jgi:hypothetical protein
MQYNFSTKSIEIMKLASELPADDIKRLRNLVEAYLSKDKDKINLAEYHIHKRLVDAYSNFSETDQAKYRGDIAFHKGCVERLGKMKFGRNA